MNKPHLVHPKYKWYGVFVCSLGALFYCYEYLLRIEPSVMVPQLMESFQINAQGLGWLVGMYYYAYTPMQLVVGISTDHFGPRKVLVTALFLCAAGSLLFGLSNNLYLAGFGRLLVGAGSAFAFVCALKLASLWLAPRYFALFAGLTTALGMLGAMFGDIGLHKAVINFGWHNVLMMSAIVGAILVPIFLVSIVDRNAAHTKTSDSIKDLISGLYAMMKSHQMWFNGLIGCMLYLSLSAFGEMWGIPYLDSFKGINREMAVQLNSLIFFGWLVGSPLSGWISDCVKSRRRPLMVGNLLAAACILVILFVKFKNPWIYALFLFLLGLFASVEILCFAVARESTSLRQTATAIGFTNMVIMFGGMVMQPLVGILLDYFWGGAYSNGARVYTNLDYHKTLIIVPCALVAAAVLSYFLKESYRDEKTSA